MIVASAIIQSFNMIVVAFTTIYSFVPHFGIVCAIVFNVGIVGGANYVNTFNHIHRNVGFFYLMENLPWKQDTTLNMLTEYVVKSTVFQVVSANREFALSAVTFADTVGILAAALAAIPVHNLICELPLP
uniref:Battenin n=1 Tax=Heterorhabditis bacteriophora TaxID=37862 RepID=A0A1I7W665_HETBA